MVKRVAMFKAEDGSLFPSEKEAREHEEFAKNSIAAKAALTIMGFETENGENGDLLDVVIKNRQAIIDALSGKASKQPRKPRAAKAKATTKVEEPVTVAEVKPTPEGLDELVSGLDEAAEVTKPDETKEVAPDEVVAGTAEAGASDDDLEALMASLNA